MSEHSLLQPNPSAAAVLCNELDSSGLKGDWMFYGHADASETGVETWWLIDLKASRATLIRNGANGHNVIMGNQKNPDGTCFKWFDVRSFPAEPPLVVAASTP